MAGALPPRPRIRLQTPGQGADASLDVLLTNKNEGKVRVLVIWRLFREQQFTLHIDGDVVDWFKLQRSRLSDPGQCCAPRPGLTS